MTGRKGLEGRQAGPGGSFEAAVSRRARPVFPKHCGKKLGYPRCAQCVRLSVAVISPDFQGSPCKIQSGKQ